jgi:hypothetical protein
MLSSTTNVPQTNPKEGLEAQVETATGQFIYIRIHNALLRPILATATNPPANPEALGHLYLIKGTYEDIQRYAGTTVDWVAHLLCDPLGEGHVYTHTTGTSSDWYSLDKTSSWRQVVQGDPLRPGIYEFESSTRSVLLSKISERETHSVTTPGSKPSATTFDRHIRLREGAACGVTRMPIPVISSHLIPKRMGTVGARDVITRFSGPQTALGIDAFDPRIGILLLSNLDVPVDYYKLGFYHAAVSYYIDFGFLLFTATA